jgi:hypothetical protein
MDESVHDDPRHAVHHGVEQHTPSPNHRPTDRPTGVAAHGSDCSEYYQGNRVQLLMEACEDEYGPGRWTEGQKQIDSEDDGEESQILRASTLRHLSLRSLLPRDWGDEIAL